MEADNDVDEDDDLELTPSAFAVRMSADNQIVGIFVAVSLDHLADLVDQACDPAATEYLSLGIGGVYVGSRTPSQWPPRWETGDAGERVDVIAEDADPLKGACLDDFWGRDMDDGEWLPLVRERALRVPPKRRLRGRGPFGS